ncbi:hypothetical protein [Sediminibacterium sp. TEGAF015]|uniref:hypothetical protein n=1 Tax=Sediminibacterium sp. TEGAF015 TaxID=575378 RepID=UPI0021FB309F|nr:hypothetical protein [Sediminibacterium sp. TEGAF015]BDQ12045.1 hydrogenase [Sediminibacterium sp. TEGAF015]
MSIHMQKKSAHLILLGLLLFIMGLLVGLSIQFLPNPRMGLSAHLEGIMNGMFLMLLGLLWDRLVLSKEMTSIAFYLVVYSAFANLLAVLIGAATGFGKMMPIAGGIEGSLFIESIIGFLLISLTLTMLTACGIIFFGFYRYMRNK